MTVALLALLAACVRSSQPTRDIPPTRRHVLLVTIDTLRPDYLSANGYDLPTSPHIDSLMATGVSFTRAIAPVPRTTPALASLLTGAYPRTTGVRTLVASLTPEVVSVAELANQQGYATVAVVSNHVLGPERGLDRGFDVYDFADDSRDAAATTSAALRHMDKYQGSDAVFAWVHYIDPHVPYYPPPELVGRFDPSYEGPYRLHFGAVKGGTGDRAYPEDLGKVNAVFNNTLPAAVNAHIRRLYAADIRHTDDQVSRLITSLRRQFRDDWLIILTADHGESLGENEYFYDHGDYVSNAEIKVPLVFVFPPTDPLHGSRVVTDWVSLVDVMPTIVELLNLSVPRHLASVIEGRSLVPYMRGQDLPPRPVFAECGRSYFPSFVRRRVSFDVAGRFRTVIFGDQKLIWTPGQTPSLEFQLYDLRSDPGEATNLYRPDQPAPVHLQALLHEWARPVETHVSTMSDADRERLRSLGYLE